MSLASATSRLDPDGEDTSSKARFNLAQPLRGVSRFVRELTMQLRFGRLSRSPLRLTRLLIKEDGAECDWTARNQDPWDADLSRDIGKRHASLQALKDAIDIRALLFASLPELRKARFRVYRECCNRSRELIIVGNVRRDENAHRSVHSLAMRAKLVGLRFDLDDGCLRRLDQISLCD